MDELRVTAAYFVKESDLTKAAKFQIMNFLENEATDAQVMVLLLDGEIKSLDEMAETIVYDRYDSALLEGKFGAAWSAAKMAAKKGGIATARAGVGVAKKVPQKYRFAAGDAARATGKGLRRGAMATSRGAKFTAAKAGRMKRIKAAGAAGRAARRGAIKTGRVAKRGAMTAGRAARSAGRGGVSIFKKAAAKLKASMR